MSLTIPTQSPAAGHRLWSEGGPLTPGGKDKGSQRRIWASESVLFSFSPLDEPPLVQLSFSILVHIFITPNVLASFLLL